MYLSDRRLDVSSFKQVRRAMDAGVPADHISLSTQELPKDFAELVDMGVKLNACSLSQLERFGKHYAGKGQRVGVRVNPGVGSGGFSKSTTGFSKTNVGGPSSSFGIWNSFLEDGTVSDIVEKYGLVVERIHTHIGSGSDPAVWQQVATKSLSFCKMFDTVTSLNLGGGYKVGRNPGEPTTDLQEIGAPVTDAFQQFAADTGRQLKLEIEPGTYLVAMAGALVSTVQDKVMTTGDAGHTFLKLDAGMTDVLRPSLYGAVHPITVLPGTGKSDDIGDESESVVVVGRFVSNDYCSVNVLSRGGVEAFVQPTTHNIVSTISTPIMLGHCCESGDLMSPQEGDPEALGERMLRKAEIGDLLIMDGSGAYCSGMSTKNYNSFPEAPEVLVNEKQNKVHLIRKRQAVEQIWANEVVTEGIFEAEKQSA